MLITPTFSKNPKTANKVFLIQDKKEIKKLKMSEKEKAFFRDELKEKESYLMNAFGTFMAVFTFNDLKEASNRERLRLAGDEVYNEMASKIKSLQVVSDSTEAISLFIEGIALSSYKFDKYFTEKKPVQLKEVITSDSSVDVEGINHIVDATCWARTLVNEPVSYLTAEQLSKDVQKKCENAGIKIEVFTKAKIQSLKMGGLLAVNKGSIDPPTFTIMEWKPKAAKNSKPIILVGKGIVYDTGGLSLKSTPNSMDMMKSDMAGAAAVVAVTYAAAKLNIPLHIITLVPATDNRPGGNAYVPGDVITMYSGKTVEVMNTDAEGRLALADALTYANKFKPELVIDAATLTGAAVRSVGTFAACVMGTAGQKEFDRLNEAGQFTYDRVVQFPFWDDYKEELESSIADLKNLGGPYAGMITAGKFLEHFTDYPYIHIDIAGPAFNTKKDKYRGIGGTGAGVRLLTEFLKRKAQES